MTSPDDLRMLRAILDEAATFDEERAEAFESTRQAFADMLRKGRELSQRQREWVRGVYESVIGEPQYLNEYSAGKIPKGRDVPLPPVLQNLPKRPPARKAETE